MELLGLLLALEVERGVLVDQLVQGDGDLVLVALRLGLDRVGDGGLGNDELRQDDRVVLGREGVAGRGLLELRDGDDVAGARLRHVDVLLALRQEEPGEALGDPARRVPVAAVRLEVAAAHAQVGDPAGERVGHRLEDLRHRRVLLVAEDLDGLAVLAGALDGASPRAREAAPRRRRGCAATPIPRAEDAQRTGKTLRAAISACRPGSRSAGSSVPWAKNFSMSASSPSATISTSFSCSSLARPARSVGDRAVRRACRPRWRWASIRTRSIVPRKAFSSPTGIWSDTTSRPNFFWSDSITRSKEARSRSIRLTTKRTGRANSAANFQAFSVWTSTPGDGVEHDQRRVGGGHGGPRLRREDAVARGVQEVDPDVPVDRVGAGEVDRDLALDLLAVEVGRAGALVDLAGPRRGARRRRAGPRRGSSFRRCCGRRRRRCAGRSGEGFSWGRIILKAPSSSADDRRFPALRSGWPSRSPSGCCRSRESSSAGCCRTGSIGSEVRRVRDPAARAAASRKTSRRTPSGLTLREGGLKFGPVPSHVRVREGDLRLGRERRLFSPWRKRESPGRRLTKLGRYEVLNELGKGAMGVVYLAKDPVIGRMVAIKTIRTSSFGDDDSESREFRERFIREAQTAGILSHPNIVTIHDIGEDPDTQTSFIAMEYIEGQEPQVAARARRAKFAYEQIADIIAQVAEAIDYAHRKGIIHRDIKPANIIITTDGKVKIIDFGIAKIASSNLTTTGQFLGTPNYMSPEQVSGAAVDGRSDIFSLGVVLYELLTNRKPFQGENLTAISYKIVHEEFTPPAELSPEVPSDFNAIVARAMAKDPWNRYQRGKDFALALHQLKARLEEQRALQDLGSMVSAAENMPTLRLENLEKARPGRVGPGRQARLRPCRTMPTGRTGPRTAARTSASAALAARRLPLRRRRARATRRPGSGRPASLEQSARRPHDGDSDPEQPDRRRPSEACGRRRFRRALPPASRARDRSARSPRAGSAGSRPAGCRRRGLPPDAAPDGCRDGAAAQPLARAARGTRRPGSCGQDWKKMLRAEVNTPYFWGAAGAVALFVVPRLRRAPASRVRWWRARPRPIDPVVEKETQDRKHALEDAKKLFSAGQVRAEPGAAAPGSRAQPRQPAGAPVRADGGERARRPRRRGAQERRGGPEPRGGARGARRKPVRRRRAPRRRGARRRRRPGRKRSRSRTRRTAEIARSTGRRGRSRAQEEGRRRRRVAGAPPTADGRRAGAGRAHRAAPARRRRSWRPGPATLRLLFDSPISDGSVMIYVNDEKALQKPFDFSKKAGFFKRVDGTGTVEAPIPGQGRARRTSRSGSRARGSPPPRSRRSPGSSAGGETRTLQARVRRRPAHGADPVGRAAAPFALRPQIAYNRDRPGRSAAW